MNMMDEHFGDTYGMICGIDHPWGSNEIYLLT
jgi:hypothetical protein